MYIEIYITLFFVLDVYRNLYNSIFLFSMYRENYIRKEISPVFTYATAFRTADKKTRKILIQNLAEEYEESDVHERRYLKKQYDEIKEILFQEGKRPM